MKLELSIRRKGGSFIEFPAAGGNKAATYHFRPEAPDGPHVCDVTNADHLKRLLSIEGYTLFGADNAALVSKPPNVATPQAGANSKPEDENDGDGEGEGEGEGAPSEAVAEIRDLSVRDLKAKINTYAEEDLRAALVLEEAEAKPRTSWIDVVKAHLG